MEILILNALTNKIEVVSLYIETVTHIELNKVIEVLYLRNAKLLIGPHDCLNIRVQVLK